MATKGIVRNGCAAITFLMCTGALEATSALAKGDGGNEAGSFGQRVHQVVSDLKHPEFDDELYTHPLMREMFNCPECFAAEGQRFLLQHPELPELESRVAILALQCMRLDEYLKLLDRLSEAPKSKVSEWVLFHSVVPGLESSTRLAMGFRDRKIRKALSRAAHSPNATAKLKDAVREILDGTTASFLAREKWVTTLKCDGKM